MATIEENVLLRTIDRDGNERIMYPVTTVDNVQGLNDLIGDINTVLDSIIGQ